MIEVRLDSYKKVLCLYAQHRRQLERGALKSFSARLGIHLSRLSQVMLGDVRIALDRPMRLQR